MKTKSSIRKIFSDNLRKARKSKGWSQEEAAKRLSVTRPAWGSYEEGRAEPSFELLQRICCVFGIKDLNAFLFGEPAINKKPPTIIIPGGGRIKP